MKKIYAKYKILVNGLHILNNYNVDGFTLKKGYFDKDYFNSKRDTNKEGMEFNPNLYLTSCLNDYENLSYSFFESDDYVEFEVPNKTKIDKNNIDKLFNINSGIIDIVNDLEKKLRLVLNIPLLFQVIYIEIFNHNKEYLFYMRNNKHISFWNRLEYNLSPNELNNNSRLKIDFNSVKNTGNNYFDRALEFYNDSFESENITNRYILIFSSLEAIFNLDAEEVTTKLARFSAKILSEDNQIIYDEIYNNMKKLYKKRCDYIHGSKINNILDSDEKLLRKYTRKIIIAYWTIILSTNKTATQILRYLDSNEKLDIQIRLSITTLNSDNFSDQQHNIIKMIEKEFNIKIPDDVKKNLLSHCDKK